MAGRGWTESVKETPGVRLCLAPAQVTLSNFATCCDYNYAEKHVFVGMDEASRQLLSDAIEPLPMRPGKPRRVDDKYERHGTRSLFMFYNPIDGLVAAIAATVAIGPRK